MQLTIHLIALLTAITTTTSVTATPLLTTRAVNPDLVPAFGIQAGVHKGSGATGTCVGAKGVAIPCNCPPPRDAFIAKLNQNVAAGSSFGTPISFPTGKSAADEIARKHACLITLQNFRGSPGVGCPAASAPNFL